MVTAEKLTWIKANLRRGDKKKINDLFPGVDYFVVVAVLNGRLWGEHGENITNATVKYLKERIKREEEEKAEYSALLEN